MSRSVLRSPFHGITTARSEKVFKALEHRSYRAACRKALAHDRDLPEYGGRFGNPWDGPKDGKTRFDPKERPDLLRK